MARAKVSAPELPTHRQVEAVQEFINHRLAPRRFRLVVQRTAVKVVGAESPADSGPGAAPGSVNRSQPAP